MSRGLVDRVDRYLHAVPLSGAAAEEIGPFTLFRTATAWPYYARPRPGAPGPVTEHDVEDVAARCRELGLPLALEWVTEVAPSVGSAAAAAGLAVEEHPLLVLDRSRFEPVAWPARVDIRVLAPDTPSLVEARAVAEVAFGAAGGAGLAERDREVERVGLDQAEALTERARRGVTVTVAAIDADAGVVGSGQHQPVGEATEIVAVATLPSARRRGIAAAITSELVRHALAQDVELVLLSADSEAVARMYERLGFRRIGRVGAAEPAGR